MQNEPHKQEIQEIRKHIRYLNVAGMAAIFTLVIAGFMAISELTGFDGPGATGPIEQAAAAVTPAPGTDEQALTTEEPATAQATNPADEPVPATTAPVQSDSKEIQSKATSMGSVIRFDEDLQSFDASCNSGSLNFTWITVGSPKFAYEIEKSTDKEHYEVFTRAPAPEKKDGKNVYTVEETTTPAEKAYYRLRKVLGKGKFEYSSEVQVTCGTEDAARTTVDVFPNGYGSFRILINSPSETSYKVTLTDVNEKELATQDYQAKAGVNEFTLISDSITRGNYVLRVSNDNMVREKKVVLK